MYRGLTAGRVKIIFFEKSIVRRGLIARFTVAEPVGNAQGLVFFEFQQKTTFYRPKLAKRGCACDKRCEIDSSLRKQIDQGTTHICERHFQKDLIETCKFRWM